jgi:low affinity Fe/Cu permease
MTDTRHRTTSRTRSGFASALHETFSRFAQVVSHATGHPVAFLLALLVVIVWALSGPLFGYSDTWQLVINTGTTIVTFLMVFLIQNTQNRDTLALQLKLSELVLAQEGARNTFVDVEDLSEAELEKMHRELCRQADHALTTLEKRRGDKEGQKKAHRGRHK